ncbi:MAG TPA: hypothetical protein VF163_10350 [Micromonosporaceae bacterium]
MGFRMPRRQPPPDQEQVEADDALIDQTSQSLPTDADPVTAMLSTWRVQIADAANPDLERYRKLLASAPGVIRHGRHVRRRQRRRKIALTVAAAATVLTGGLTIATLEASPQSPLWPLAQVLFPERAALALAQRELTDAQLAAGAGHHQEALEHLARASAILDQLGDEPGAAELQQEVDTWREALDQGHLPDRGSGPGASPTTDPGTGNHEPNDRATVESRLPGPTKPEPSRGGQGGGPDRTGEPGPPAPQTSAMPIPTPTASPSDTG